MVSDERSDSGSTVETMPVGYERTLHQMFELYINPEIARRQAAGAAPTPMGLIYAQVLFKREGTEVRLNSEVKGAMKPILPKGKSMEPGQPIYLSDIEGIERYELPPEDRNHGHFTAILRGADWLLLFDFRRNQGTARQLVAKARDYLESARLAQGAALWGPFCDNLFSASELLAKAQLIVHVLDSSSKSHGQIHSKLNSWGRTGNVRIEFVSLFNRLSAHRAEARYEPRSISRPKDDEKMVRVVEEEEVRLAEAFATMWPEEAELRR